MALTQIQKDIMASIAGKRSDSSYIAGGLVLNMDWPRVSDDIDIFHDTDEEIGSAANADIKKPSADGFKVSVEIQCAALKPGAVELTTKRRPPRRD